MPGEAHETVASAMGDSPVTRPLKAEVRTDSGAKEAKDPTEKEVIESKIKKAFRKRASYIKSNSEKMTTAMLRRFLEKDLQLQMRSLDPHKMFINEQLYEVLKAYVTSRLATNVKRNSLKKEFDARTSKKPSTGERSDSLDSEADEEKEEMNDKKKIAPKRKMSDDDQTVEKPVKNKGATAPGNGERVERLKSVIRSCGMRVPPIVYRKVKEGSVELREANLIKELEQILAKEGISTNPSEKEIKEVKRRKERARELEGIDMSNIVSSSRRRSALSFTPHPKPKIPEGSKIDDSEESENGEDGKQQEDEDSSSEDEDDYEEESE